MFNCISPILSGSDLVTFLGRKLSLTLEGLNLGFAVDGRDPSQGVLLLLGRGQVRTQVQHRLGLRHERPVRLVAVVDEEPVHEVFEGCDLVKGLLLLKKYSISFNIGNSDLLTVIMAKIDEGEGVNAFWTKLPGGFYCIFINKFFIC